MLTVIRRRKAVVNLPFGLASVMGSVFETLAGLSGGIIPAQITRDQVASLKSDNVVSAGARGFAELGITPTSLEAVLPDYLWRFRPSGQYDLIKESARNMRAD